MNPPILHLDRSGPGSIYFEQDGRRVSIEQAFASGFRVEPNDVPCLLTPVAEFLKAKGDS